MHLRKSVAAMALLLPVVLSQYCSKSEIKPVKSAAAGEPALPTAPFNYVINYPPHIQAALPATDNTPADNPITNDGATLGRVLFYDTHLSKNDKISCGSCHRQEFAFDDTARLSRGFEEGLTPRNSMAILNIRFYRSGKMFWDERSASAEKQALQPIQNHVEMGLTLSELENKVSSLAYYPPLFQKAFGSTTIDSVRIAKAIAQFERSIVTYQAKYDRVKQGLENFSPLEAQGEQLFLTAGAVNTCATCHAPPMFIKSNTPAFAFPDATDAGIDNLNKFKSGSLRNIAGRLSLFHNGSVANLQSMLTAGAPGSGTTPIPGHSVLPQDVQRLTAFLNTLTDNSILTEEKFSNPFK